MNDQMVPPDNDPPADVRRPPSRRALLGLAGVGAVGALNLGAFAWAGGWITPQRLTPSRFADRFEQVHGVHPGFRRNHAKGVSATGRFISNGAGEQLSKAAVFRPGSTPVTARFSLSGGMPTVADSDDATRGLGVLFHLPGGQQWRTAMVNVPVFPVNTPEGFFDRVAATAPVAATGKPDPDKLAAFLERHPETVRAMKVIKATPRSSGFANSPYNGLNAFFFTNAAGIPVPVRWSLSPEDPFVPASKGSDGPTRNYLFNQLIDRVSRGPVRWRMLVTVGKPGDPTHDATIPWPSNRQQVDAGTLSLDVLHTESAGTARDINFDPLVLPEGISASDDPLPAARSAVYARSYARRASEPHSPSAVNVAKVLHAR